MLGLHAMYGNVLTLLLSFFKVLAPAVYRGSVDHLCFKTSCFVHFSPEVSLQAMDVI